MEHERGRIGLFPRRRHIRHASCTVVGASQSGVKEVREATGVRICAESGVEALRIAVDRQHEAFRRRRDVAATRAGRADEGQKTRDLFDSIQSALLASTHDDVCVRRAGLREAMRGTFKVSYMFLAVMLLVLPSARAAERIDRTDQFPRPASLEPQIRFWRAIFTDYSERQVVLHDAF